MSSGQYSFTGRETSRFHDSLVNDLTQYVSLTHVEEREGLQTYTVKKLIAIIWHI